MKTLLALVAVAFAAFAVACSGAPADDSREPVSATQSSVTIERTPDAFDATHAVRPEFFAVCTPVEIQMCHRYFPDGATCVLRDGKPVCLID
jgi:hypothetical protein